MHTVIYYYTGTGNSLWTSRVFAGIFGGTEIVPMRSMNHIREGKKPDRIGFFFPVHIWGVPRHVCNFLQSLKKWPDVYYFAVAVNAGQVSRTLIQLKELMAGYGLTLSAGFDIRLPSNYIPWGGPGDDEAQQILFNAAIEKIRFAATYVTNRKSGLIEKGPLWQRFIFTLIHKMTYNLVLTMDKNFNIEGECNSCGICEKVCSVRNISMETGIPLWRGNCEQCLACLQWCPKECIQYGRKTKGYKRYHHPEVTVDYIFREKCDECEDS